MHFNSILKLTNVGYLYGLGFCIVTALSVTMIHLTTIHFDPYFSLFITTLCAVIYFNMINITSLKKVYTRCYQHRYLWILISFFVFGNWVATFYSLSKINPFLYIFTYFTSSAVIATCFDFYYNRKNNDVIFIFFSVIVFGVFCDKYIFFSDNNIVQFAGIVSAILSAGFGYGYRRFSVKFSQLTMLSATQVLAVRFYLLLIISCILMSHVKTNLISSPKELLNFIFLGCLTFIIPLYLMQKSVLLINAEKFSVLTSLCPAITAVIQIIILDDNNYFYIFLSVLIFLFAIVKLALKKDIAKNLITYHRKPVENEAQQ